MTDACGEYQSIFDSYIANGYGRMLVSGPYLPKNKETTQKLTIFAFKIDAVDIFPFYSIIIHFFHYCSDYKQINQLRMGIKSTKQNIKLMKSEPNRTSGTLIRIFRITNNREKEI